MIRRAQYSREIVLFERWRIPYAPAYGWRSFWRSPPSPDASGDELYEHYAHESNRRPAGPPVRRKNDGEAE